MDDVTLGRALAHGRTAAVYAWGDGRVLKLFNDRFSERAVKHEADVARASHACGQPAPAVHDVVCVSGRYGIVYERVDGPTMLDMLRQSRGVWCATHVNWPRFRHTCTLLPDPPRYLLSGRGWLAGFAGRMPCLMTFAMECSPL